MKTNQHIAEQIIKILEPADKGDQTIGAICRNSSHQRKHVRALAENLRRHVCW